MARAAMSEPSQTRTRRIPMAVEAPAHGQALDLIDRSHVADIAVAIDAADAARHVDRVVEVDEIGERMDAPPADRTTRGNAVSDRRDQGAVVPDLCMASHASIGARD